MKPRFMKVLAVALALALTSFACGRKGDPSPRRSPRDVPPTAAPLSQPGAPQDPNTTMGSGETGRES